MKYIILAPHVDDEMIGCFKFLQSMQVSDIVYFYELSSERLEEASLVCSDFGSTLRIQDSLNSLIGFDFSEQTTLLVPSIRDSHPHHKAVNLYARKFYPKNPKLFYSVDMNQPGKTVLSKEEQADKKSALFKYYPSQRELFDSDAKYYLFEHISDSDLKKSIFINTQFEGIHCYPDAPEGVEFLKHPHRHIFHVRVELDVFHNDREVEFILFKREIESLLQPGNMNFKSCEMIAEEILNYVVTKYSFRNCKVTISEDLENGATLEYLWG